MSQAKLKKIGGTALVVVGTLYVLKNTSIGMTVAERLGV